MLLAPPLLNTAKFDVKVPAPALKLRLIAAVPVIVNEPDVAPVRVPSVAVRV